MPLFALEPLLLFDELLFFEILLSVLGTRGSLDLDLTELPLLCLITVLLLEGGTMRLLLDERSPFMEGRRVG